MLLCGAIVLLFCDTICQVLSNSFALPVNTVTTLVGSPFVIYLLFKTKLLNG
ncbi:MAG: iron chelate uptake ABC transporter family permease subunit [Bacteroidia bacterium]